MGREEGMCDMREPIGRGDRGFDRAFARPESGRRAREKKKGREKKRSAGTIWRLQVRAASFGGDDDGGGKDLERKGGRRGCARAHLLDVHDAIAVFEVVRWNVALDQLLDVLQALLRRDDGEGWLGVSGARDVGGGVARDGAPAAQSEAEAHLGAHLPARFLLGRAPGRGHLERASSPEHPGLVRRGAGSGARRQGTSTRRRKCEGVRGRTIVGEGRNVCEAYSRGSSFHRDYTRAPIWRLARGA